MTTSTRANESLGITVTDRGFLRGDDIPSSYGGGVQVYESSAASGPYLWVRVVCLKDMNNPNGLTVEAVAHLTIENATRLRDQLTWLIDQHYQTVASKE